MGKVDLDLFEPFDSLIEIEVLGRPLQVPDSNCILRSLQYVAGDAIAYGRFCWNDECGNCEVTCLTPGAGEPVVVRACQQQVSAGMKILAVSEDLDIAFE
ncbi:MAG TPA: hypothetical protein VFG76_02265 [Candidatus Polarisedimenticolia bacterium]|nr:hypothetical protein [Candidatus Polarisedimenticolia bacterium]